MKVIFLDVDGVLNTYKTWSIGNEYPFTQMCLERLAYLVDKTDAKIVLSSTWRKSFNDDMTPDTRFDKDALKLLKALDSVFLKLHGKTIDIDIGPNFYRGYQIKHYLENHPEVTNYVILDDNSDMLDEQRPYFIQTDPSDGLVDTDVQNAILILNGTQVSS